MRFEQNFRLVIFKLISVIGGWGNSCEIALRWMPLDLTDDKSILVQVMAWCRQATSHYLSQCWPRFISPYGVTRPQWVNNIVWSTRSSSKSLTSMMTSSPGNADICDDVMTGKHFRHYWLFVDPVSNAEFYDLLDVSLNKRLKKKTKKKTVEVPAIGTLCRSCDVTAIVK